MPTVRDFRSKNKKRVSHYHASEPIVKATRARRRPGREEVEAAAKGHDVDEDEDEIEVEAKPKRSKEKHGKKARVEAKHDDGHEDGEDDGDHESETASVEAEAEATESGERIEIQFKGSELLRAKFPKTFELAEEVATQWLHDGNFEGLPIGHPLGQWAAQQGLTKAKKIEKKIVESPLFEKAAIGVLTYGMKAQGLVQKLKDRFQSRGLD